LEDVLRDLLVLPVADHFDLLALAARPLDSLYFKISSLFSANPLTPQALHEVLHAIYHLAAENSPENKWHGEIKQLDLHFEFSSAPATSTSLRRPVRSTSQPP
jgi:hypothetical protein